MRCAPNPLPDFRNSRGAFGFVLITLLLFTSQAAAIPVRVLARSTIDVRVQEQWNQLRVFGVVSDDRGAGVAGAEVNLSIPGWDQRQDRTNGQGKFSFTLDAHQIEEIMAAKGTQRGARVPLELSFSGNSKHGASHAAQVVDLSKEFVQLHAAVTPPEIPLGSTARVLVALRHGSDPVPAQELRFTVGDHEQRLTTDSNGQANLAPVPDLEPGRHAIVIEYAGTRRYNAARITRSLIVLRHTVLSLKVIQRSPDGLSIQVAGTLRGGGKAIAGAVTLLVQESAYKQVESDHEGRFSCELDLVRAAALWGPRKSTIRASYAPTEAWDSFALSPALNVHLPSPPSAPLWVYLSAFLLLFGSALVSALVRSGRIQAWLAAYRDRVAPAPTRLGTSIDGHARLVDRAPKHPLSGAVQHIQGVVWNNHLERPIPDASIVISGAQDLNLSSDAQGRFQTPDLQNGSYHIQLTAPGCVSESFHLRIPHGGHFVDCRIRLTPWRSLALRAYASQIRAHSDSGVQLGWQTPRELEWALAHEGAADPEALQALTGHFERLYYGGDKAIAESDHQRFLALLHRVWGGARSEVGP